MSGEPSRDMTYCRECGTALGRDRNYCTECGAPQDDRQGQQPAGGQQTHPSQQSAEQRRPAEDDGRSLVMWAVIGVAVLFLLVPVLVVLAAVVAAFTLGLGDTSTAGPQVSFDYEYAEQAGELTVIVQSGESVDADQVTFEGEGFHGAGTTWATQSGSSERVSAGDQVTLTGVEEDFELHIAWRSADGEDSSILSSRTGPAA